MSEIKRYDLAHVGYNDAEMRAHPDGDYVDYTDHLAAVEAAVMAEREACAALAQKSYETGYDYSEGGCLHEVIRARTTKPAGEST